MKFDDRKYIYRTTDKCPSFNELWDEVKARGLDNISGVTSSSDIGPKIATFLLAATMIGVFAAIFLKLSTLCYMLIPLFFVLISLSILLFPDKNKSKTEMNALRLCASVVLVYSVVAYVFLILGLFGNKVFSPSVYLTVASIACFVLSLITIVWVVVRIVGTGSRCDARGEATLTGYADELLNVRNPLYRGIVTTPVYTLCYGGSSYLIMGEQQYRGGDFTIPKIGSTARVFFNSSDPYEVKFSEKYKIPAFAKGAITVGIILGLVLIFVNLAVSSGV